MRGRPKVVFERSLFCLEQFTASTANTFRLSETWQYFPKR